MPENKPIEWPAPKSLKQGGGQHEWKRTVELVTALMSEHFTQGVRLDHRYRDEIFNGICESAIEWQPHADKLKSANRKWRDEPNKAIEDTLEQIRKLSLLAKAVEIQKRNQKPKSPVFPSARNRSQPTSVMAVDADTTQVWSHVLAGKPESAIHFRILEANLKTKDERNPGKVIDATLSSFKSDHCRSRIALHPQHVFTRVDSRFVSSMQNAIKLSTRLGQVSGAETSSAQLDFCLALKYHSASNGNLRVEDVPASSAIPSELAGPSSSLAIAVAVKALLSGRNRLDQDVYWLGQVGNKGGRAISIEPVQGIPSKVAAVLSLKAPSTFVIVCSNGDNGKPALPRELFKILPNNMFTELSLEEANASNGRQGKSRFLGTRYVVVPISEEMAVAHDDP